MQGSSDVQAMFASKRRAGRKGQGILSFRFDSSRHAMSINTYMKEQRDLELAEVMNVCCMLDGADLEVLVPHCFYS